MKQEQEKSETAKKVLAYVPFKTFLSFVDRLAINGCPGRIDRSLMAHMSGGYQSQLFAALHSLGLVSEKAGKPTDLFKALVNSDGEQRKGAFNKLAQFAYPFLFAEGFDLKTSTSEQVSEAFEKNTGATGETVRKSIKFFIDLANSGGLEVSPYIKPPKSRTGRKPGKQNTAQISRKRDSGDDDLGQHLEEEGSDKKPSWEQMLLKKFPDFDPSWSDDLKAKWFEGFEKLMKKGETEE